MRVSLPLKSARPFVLLFALSAVLAALAVLAAAPPSASAQSSGSLKVVRYDGVSVRVPRAWPVYRISRRSTTCVRFNRHAVYLGQPGVAQDCPVAGTGRTEAILVEPAPATPVGLGGTGVGLLRTHHALITATWRAQPATIARAVGLHSLARMISAANRHVRVHAGSAHAGTSTAHAASMARAARAKRAVSAAAPAIPGATFTGEGFDACSTPSQSAMAAWGSSSPYGAVGVYIGGVNMACSQPNLTASWVQTESAAGWHIIPIYVGDQAPSNACGCAAMTASQAASEGAAAAVDAIYEAQVRGIGAGNPIYYDMEGYTRDSANSRPVLAFLQSWTEQLHADGYMSGVYSSDGSGIADLVAAVGSGYVEPDDVWIANWNGQADTADATVPSTDWTPHRRLHQYQGGANETYGGVRINVDNDALDGASAAYGSASGVPAATVPTASATPTLSGTPVVGQTLIATHATWTPSPSSDSDQWERCDWTGANCSPITGATGLTYTLTTADIGQTVLMEETAANSVGTSAASDSPPSAAIAASPAGFWAFTPTGAVLNTPYQLQFGSPATDGLTDFVGMAATAGRHGYWLATRHGSVFAFGNAASFPTPRIAHPLIGIVRAPSGGYWLYTAQGNVYSSPGTGFYGSPARLKLSDITGMASLPNGPGYWLVTRTGTVFAFGRAPTHPILRPAHPVIGIVAAPNHGYWLYTAQGNVYNSVGAPFYGSPHGSGVAAMLATPDGKGYWLITHGGTVSGFGDAARYAAPAPLAAGVVGAAG